MVVKGKLGGIVDKPLADQVIYKSEATVHIM